MLAITIYAYEEALTSAPIFPISLITPFKKVVEVAKVEIVSLPQLKQQMKRECSKLQPIPARED